MSDRIVLTMSLDPTLDPALTDGARRCLSLIRSLAGHARKLVTLTCSLARRLGRSTNTIRDYLRQLEEAGYIWWEKGDGWAPVLIYLRESVEPPSRRAQLAERKQEPRRSTWGLWPRPARARRDSDPAQFAAPIKTSKEERRLGKGWNGVAQAPIRTVAEQLAILLGS